MWLSMQNGGKASSRKAAEPDQEAAGPAPSDAQPTQPPQAPPSLTPAQVRVGDALKHVHKIIDLASHAS
jgi:hypothetical protein